MVQRNTSLHRNGKNGDQFLDKAQNKTLAESPKSNIQLYLFEVFEPGRYIYQGKVSLIEKPYQAMQRDEGGLRRKVWIFPLALQHNQITISDKEYNAYTAIQEKKANSLNETELKARAKEHLSKKPSKRTIYHNAFFRDPFVAKYTKARAKGICQLCKQPAPFMDENGEPYLESHHIVWLSRGGDDSIENTVALCPNCHRKMHILDLAKDREFLASEVKHGNSKSRRSNNRKK